MNMLQATPLGVTAWLNEDIQSVYWCACCFSTFAHFELSYVLIAKPNWFATTQSPPIRSALGIYTQSVAFQRGLSELNVTWFNTSRPSCRSKSFNAVTSSMTIIAIKNVN